MTDAVSNAHMQASKHYPRGADRVKMNRKEFLKEMTGAHYVGQFYICDWIMDLIKENPDIPLPELFGELQLKVQKIWNDFAAGPGKGIVMKMENVEHLIYERSPWALHYKSNIGKAAVRGSHDNNSVDLEVPSTHPG